MNQQESITDSLTPPMDEVEIQEIETDQLINTSATDKSLSSSSFVPKTARDQFFEDLQHEKDKNRWSAKCKLCKKPKRVIDKFGVTSNFNRHARENHREPYEQWLNECKKVNPVAQKTKITSHFQKKKHVPGRRPYNPNDSRQIELSMAIVNDLIIGLGLPLSIVDRPAFINFMNKVDPKFTMTSRRTLTRTTIPSLYHKMNEDLKTFCLTASSLSLALDIWTDRKLRSFFAITGMILLIMHQSQYSFKLFSAHAIVDGNFKSYVLCFVPLWGSHSSSLLLQKYEEIVNKFEIKNKVIRIVTDSASNNIGAFQNMIIPGFEQYFAEDDDDELNYDDSDTNVNDGNVSDEYEYPSDFSSTIAGSLPCTDLTIEDLIQESFDRIMDGSGVFRISCFAHTIQLVVKDGLQETKTMLTALEKVSSIAKHAHTSTKFAEKLDLMKASIPRAVITRWNSQFMCVERILAIPSIELNDILVQLKYKHLCLNARDLSMLQEFVALLSLFAEATTVTQRQNSPSIHMWRQVY